MRVGSQVSKKVQGHASRGGLLPVVSPLAGIMMFILEGAKSHREVWDVS